MQHQTTLCLNKPMYLGFSVLDLSKIVMYEFYYDVICPTFNNNCGILYTDTDSFILELFCKNLDEKLNDVKEKFDFSNFPKDHKLYSDKNRKKLGTFKDEFGATDVIKFVGLKPKMYCILSKDQIIKRAKGVKKYVVNDVLTCEMYENTLFSGNAVYEEMNMIQSKSHKLHTICMNKKCLSAYDDKRWILACGVNSYAYGHYKAH